MKRIKLFFLRSELKSGFTIGGYEDRLVRILGKRFCNDSEVDYVLRLRDEGKLKKAGEWKVTSPATGKTYSDIIYKPA